MTESPDMDTVFFDMLERVNGGERMDSDYLKGGYSTNEGAEARKRKQREMNKHRDAAAARDRMIRRQSERENMKDDTAKKSTDKIPLWSI